MVKLGFRPSAVVNELWGPPVPGSTGPRSGVAVCTPTASGITWCWPCWLHKASIFWGRLLLLFHQLQGALVWEPRTVVLVKPKSTKMLLWKVFIYSFKKPLYKCQAKPILNLLSFSKRIIITRIRVWNIHYWILFLTAYSLTKSERSKIKGMMPSLFSFV